MVGLPERTISISVTREREGLLIGGIFVNFTHADIALSNSSPVYML